jgi:hypothetical protein
VSHCESIHGYAFDMEKWQRDCAEAQRKLDAERDAATLRRTLDRMPNYPARKGLHLLRRLFPEHGVQL